MENPLEKVETAISQKLSAIAHHSKHPIHNRIQAILYQEMTNENMEKALTEVTERIALSLLKRYWYLLLLGIIGFLGLQVLVIKVMIHPNCLSDKANSLLKSQTGSSHSAGQ